MTVLTMMIYIFRHGKSASLWGASMSAAELIELCRKYKDRWLESGEFFDELPAGAAEFVETNLIIPPHNPVRAPKITHALARRESSEPDTVFVGAVSSDDYKMLCKRAAANWLDRHATLEKQIEEAKPNLLEIIDWNDLPPRLQVQCRGTNLSNDQCWLWRGSSEKTPYKRFYVQVRGGVPKGASLLHSCDNRRCLNPNHLRPGTAKENVQDMMSRGRHLSQRIAKSREKHRDNRRKKS